MSRGAAVSLFLRFPGAAPADANSQRPRPSSLALPDSPISLRLVFVQGQSMTNLRTVHNLTRAMSQLPTPGSPTLSDMEVVDSPTTKVKHDVPAVTSLPPPQLQSHQQPPAQRMSRYLPPDARDAFIGPLPPTTLVRAALILCSRSSTPPSPSSRTPEHACGATRSIYLAVMAADKLLEKPTLTAGNDQAHQSRMPLTHRRPLEPHLLGGAIRRRDPARRQRRPLPRRARSVAWRRVGRAPPHPRQREEPYTPACGSFDAIAATIAGSEWARHGRAQGCRGRSCLAYADQSQIAKPAEAQRPARDPHSGHASRPGLERRPSCWGDSTRSVGRSQARGRASGRVGMD